jgi:tRNA threonylcarbamoyladenosine biosynthesis protein TsaB
VSGPKGNGPKGNGPSGNGPGAAVPPAVVAIETATETVGVAVRTPEGVQAAFALTGRRRHVETLTPALEHLLAQVGLRPADLGLVAVDIGPGLFTGLRVGVAAAKALAQSLGIGLVTATSLEILTAGAFDAGHRGLVLACVDARRAEVFAGVRELNDTGAVSREPIAPGLFTPVDLVRALDVLGGAPVLAVGDGAVRYGAALEPVPGVRSAGPALSFPPPAALVRLALERVGAGETPVEPEFVVPLYMREADATSNFARAERA